MARTVTSVPRPVVGRKPDLRARRRAELISSVHRIAVRRFASQGFDNTSLEEICHEAGISLRTFFRHFTGKDDLLGILRRDLQRVALERLSSEPADLPFSEALADAVSYAYERLYHDDRQYASSCLQLLTAEAPLSAACAAEADPPGVTEMDREFGRRLELDPSDRRVRLLRAFTAIAVNRAVAEWASDSRTTLKQAIRQNLNLIAWPL